MDSSIYSLDTDGTCWDTGGSYSTARDGSGHAASNNYNTLSMLNGWMNNDPPLHDSYYVTRAYLYFDLSSVLLEISAAKLFLYGINKGNFDAGQSDLHIYEGLQSNPYVASDFTQYGSTLFGSIGYTSTYISQYNEITLNAAGLTYVNSKRGDIAKLCLRISGDVNNNAPTLEGESNYISIASADESDAAKRPYLSITTSPLRGGIKHYNIPPLRGF